MKGDERVTIPAHLRPSVCTSPNSPGPNHWGETSQRRRSTKAEVGCPEFSGEVCRCNFWGGPTMGLNQELEVGETIRVHPKKYL